MSSFQGALRRTQPLAAIPRASRQITRHAARPPGPRSQPPRGRGGKPFGLLAVFALSAGGYYFYPVLFPKEEKAEIEFEKERAHPASKEGNRDLISSQHLQVRQSWENPGVYAWGSNAGKVIDPNTKETNIKLPRRIAYFDGQILRDIKLTAKFGAAVTEKGDLVQWGLGFSSDPTPIETLKGKDIVKITVSDERVIALASNGSVYSVPSSREDQGPNAPAETSLWLPFWSSGAGPLPAASVRNLTPDSLAWGERVVDVKSGLQHCLLMTSKGRVFSAASSTNEFPSKGQMGVPGLSWTTRPRGAFDQPHELLSLKGFHITGIAAGDHHSVAMDKEGKLFAFGDNTHGQLGIQPEGGFRTIDVPTLVPVAQLYTNTGLVPKVTSVAAGGLNTFFTVDASQPGFHPDSTELVPSRRMPSVTVDTWACGNGVYGSLGNGRWMHVTPAPSKLKALSALYEFDEQANKMVPIRLSNISVGSTHAAATMHNVTRTAASKRTSENDTNWGYDVLLWGGNEHYQLGTGKRNNLNAPTYIGALDGGSLSDFHRLHLTPRKTVRLGEDGKGRKATLEQKIECGRFVTAVYSAA
ncbi:regulator of chromosome condensation 1/beta-lactamase-inhibitor protein II [Plectosphaerella plurivora]|uniref:Regulator of chromosome condensation 1/beta-lactamase-inhibitor protein II n=1 Tax=Plectosphaerella plurivora TaxID=936078 RepID=A0A9P8VAV1_9PEZI|nr:regulator of chromosome condensation 1/beta-lactamase-inhibitor protein II [Plectosphaerella plurivora]